MCIKVKNKIKKVCVIANENNKMYAYHIIAYYIIDEAKEVKKSPQFITEGFMGGTGLEPVTSCL